MLLWHCHGKVKTDKLLGVVEEEDDEKKKENDKDLIKGELKDELKIELGYSIL